MAATLAQTTNDTHGQRRRTTLCMFLQRDPIFECNPASSPTHRARARAVSQTDQNTPAGGRCCRHSGSAGQRSPSPRSTPQGCPTTPPMRGQTATGETRSRSQVKLEHTQARRRDHEVSGSNTPPPQNHKSTRDGHKRQGMNIHLRRIIIKKGTLTAVPRLLRLASSRKTLTAKAEVQKKVAVKKKWEPTPSASHHRPSW